MNPDFEELFWAPIARQFDGGDDPELWRLALNAVLHDLDAEFIWDDMPTPGRIHLVVAKQSNWWRPHWRLPGMYRDEQGGMGSYEPPDWEQHWFRKKIRNDWEFLGERAGKMKGKTSHCRTFIPARTTRHQKASVVQIWKPPISPERAVSSALYNEISWYPSGRKYLFERDEVGKWMPRT